MTMERGKVEVMEVGEEGSKRKGDWRVRGLRRGRKRGWVDGGGGAGAGRGIGGIGEVGVQKDWHGPVDFSGMELGYT